MSVISGMIEHIKKVGWYQGGYWDRGGSLELALERTMPCCLLGAYHSVTETDTTEWMSAETAAIAGVIMEQYLDRLEKRDFRDAFEVISRFNDHDETSLEDVMLVLEKAQVSTHDGL
jgi:hypothetical protein